PGYLPAQNFQRALETAVLEWLVGKDDITEVIPTSLLINPPQANAGLRFGDVLEPVPEPRRGAKPPKLFAPVKIDFVRLDAENRALGRRGEEFVFELEQRRLHDDESRPDLARRVRWRSRDEG